MGTSEQPRVFQTSAGSADGSELQGRGREKQMGRGQAGRSADFRSETTPQMANNQVGIMGSDRAGVGHCERLLLRIASWKLTRSGMRHLLGREMKG